MKVNMREFASRFEGVANIVGAYVESSLKDKGQIDQHLKGLAKTIEDYVAEAVAQRLANRSELQKVPLKVKKLENFKGELPAYQSDLASGIDVRAQLDKPLTMAPGQRALVATGLSFEIPEGYEIQARPRSGWAIKEGVSLVNTPGTIDADYRGEVKIILINLGQDDVVIEDQFRIAQLVLCPVVQAELTVVEDLSMTTRGEGGFGSTGKGDASAAVEVEVTVKKAEPVQEVSPKKKTKKSKPKSQSEA